MAAVPSEVETSTVKPPSTSLSRVKVTLAIPVSSSTITSSSVTVALSSLVIVAVPVSEVSMLDVDTVLATKLLIERVTVSCASTLVSAVGVTIKV